VTDDAALRATKPPSVSGVVVVCPVCVEVIEPVSPHLLFVVIVRTSPDSTIFGGPSAAVYGRGCPLTDARE
jgi:hypothetical protein